jgi:hypothetical protein
MPMMGLSSLRHAEAQPFASDDGGYIADRVLRVSGGLTMAG